LFYINPSKYNISNSCIYINLIQRISKQLLSNFIVSTLRPKPTSKFIYQNYMLHKIIMYTTTGSFGAFKLLLFAICTIFLTIGTTLIKILYRYVYNIYKLFPTLISIKN